MGTSQRSSGSWPCSTRSGFERRTDVLVVGCGAQGLSTALHLAHRGIRGLDVDLTAPGSPTSTRAAGQSALAQTEPACGELIRRTVDQLLRFDGEHGVPLTVHRMGSVKLALSDWAAAQLEREVERATAIGARMQLIDVATAGALAPHIAASGAFAAWHSPDDCYWQPTEMLGALHTAAQRAGVEFRRGIEVTAASMFASPRYRCQPRSAGPRILEPKVRGHQSNLRERHYYRSAGVPRRRRQARTDPSSTERSGQAGREGQHRAARGESGRGVVPRACGCGRFCAGWMRIGRRRSPQVRLRVSKHAVLQAFHEAL